MTDILGPASAPNAVTARLAEYRTFGTTDTWFKPCSNPASQDGTQVQAAWLNGIMAQLRGAIRGNGQLVNGTGPVVPEVNTTDAMLLTAVQLLIARGQPNAGTDTGTADALAVAPSTPWPEYKAGARIWVIKSSAAGPNATTAPTLAVSGLAAVAIVRRDGSALLPGDLPGGIVFCAEHDGTSFRLVSLTWGEIAGAVQSGKWLYGAATGTANAATVTLFPQQAPIDGTEILVKWPGTNTAAAPTFLLTGTSVKTPVRQGGGQIQPGDLSGYVPFIYDATLGTWRVNGLVASDVALTFGFYLGADTSTTANQVVLTSTNYPSALQIGRPFTFKVTTANTGATTIAINGAAAVSLTYRNAQALAANELVVGDVVLALYDGAKVIIAGAPRVQSVALKAQLAPTDITYDASAAADYQSTYAGTSIGSFTLPVGYSCIQLSANVFVTGDSGSSPTGTGLYMAIWANANDGSGWVFKESQRTYKAANASAQSFSRTALLTLDPTKSYSFDCRLLKDTQTSSATVPSGNLLGLALRF